MEELEYYSSNQVARELDIESALLRRLSGLIEKTLMNTGYFYRDKRNRRLYTHANINELEEILTIKKKTTYLTQLQYLVNMQTGKLI